MTRVYGVSFCKLMLGESRGKNRSRFDPLRWKDSKEGELAAPEIGGLSVLLGWLLLGPWSGCAGRQRRNVHLSSGLCARLGLDPLAINTL